MNQIVSEIKNAALDLGFNVVGVTSVDPLSHDDALFQSWCDRGFAAGMSYMTRRPDLNAHPGKLVPFARSLITLAVDYYVAAPAFVHERRFGRVARYAWGRDYHDIVGPRLKVLVSAIEKIVGHQIHARCFVDAVPILERAVAARAGLGFFGKNTNLLQPRNGSWFFLSELLLDLELPSEDKAVKVSCGSCRRCLDACPTDAFPNSYVLDSGKCISYLTIENKGEIPRALREPMGEWVFGCDVCQEVCPFNRFAHDTLWSELRPEAGVGQRLDLVEVLSIGSDIEFRARFSGTALIRPKRRGLLRNAAVVAANIGATDAVSMLISRIETDSEPLIRSHCLWAVGKLDRKRAKSIAERVVKSDPHPMVREEAEVVLEF